MLRVSCAMFDFFYPVVDVDVLLLQSGRECHSRGWVFHGQVSEMMFAGIARELFSFDVVMLSPVG